MKKRSIRAATVALLLFLAIGAVVARTYNLNDRESVDLSRVNEIVFNLRGVSCSLCVRTINIVVLIEGGGYGDDLSLGLSGRIDSNRSGAVPTLIADRQGDRVVISLFPDQATFFGLSQSGTAKFTAVLPASFVGDVSLSATVEDVSVRNVALRSLDLSLSSGNLDADGVRADSVSMQLSSGQLEAGDISARSRLVVEASSGSVSLGSIQAREIRIEAHSGSVEVDDASASGVLEIECGSGRITGGRLAGGTVRLDSSSGRIEFDTIESDEAIISASSGDVRIKRISVDALTAGLSSGDFEVDVLDASRSSIRTASGVHIAQLRGEFACHTSSGNVDLGIARLDGPIDVEASSGSIYLELPSNAGFNARLETTSGRVKSDFPIIGDVTTNRNIVAGTANGGGISIRAKSSSGNITLAQR